jgi:hypothetical protein
VQILDVGVNKPFKDYYRNAVLNWKVQHGNRAKPGRRECAEWIANAWDKIRAETITNTCRSIGFY